MSNLKLEDKHKIIIYNKGWFAKKIILFFFSKNPPILVFFLLFSL